MIVHHDVKTIDNQLAEFADEMAARGFEFEIAQYIGLRDARRLAIKERDELLTLRKRLSDQHMKANRDQDNERIKETSLAVAEVKENLAAAEHQVKHSEGDFFSYMRRFPNRLSPLTPRGAGETDNHIYDMPLRYGSRPLPHWDMDLHTGTEQATEMSGSRFVMLNGGIAVLARAIQQYLLNRVNTTYREYIPPTLVKNQTAERTGHLPKFADDLYAVGDAHILIPTGEVPLTAFWADQTLQQGKRLCALTDCFRKEAGSAGRDTRGLLRHHQFQKVELVSVCHPDDASAELSLMIEKATGILDELGLPHRKVVLCSGDLGANAMRTIDIEVWMAGQKEFREISSISHCGDYQARGMGIKIKDGKNKVYAHTLNGSCLPIGRTLAAIVEYYQIGNNDAAIPEVLRPYTGGATRLGEINAPE